MIYIMYRITIGDYTYIGSSKDFKQRKIEHKSRCNKEDNRLYNIKLYEYIRANGGWDKCEIIPIEEYECETSTQAHIREEYWRREYNANMNTIRAYRTEAEKIEQIVQVEQKRKTKHNCECGGKYTQTHIARHLSSQKHQDYLANNNISI